MKILYRVLFVVLIILAYSCQDMFETNSSTNIHLDDYFESAYDIDDAARGMYDGLQSCVEKMFVWGEVRGDLVDITENSPWELKQLNDLDVTPDNKFTDWSEFYDVINRANLIIKYAHQVSEHDYTFSKKEAEQFVAEAINVRSLCYFWLTRTFGDVPFIIEPFDENIKDTKIDTVWLADGGYKLEKMPVYRVDPTDADVILDSLEVQLKRVEGIERSYPQEVDNSGNPDPTVYTSRFKAISNLALQADIKLWRDKYQDALDLTDQALAYNEEVYSLGDYRSAPVCYDNSGRPVQRWIEIFTGTGSLTLESVLELRFQSSTPDYNVLQKYTSSKASEGGQHWVKPTDKAINYWQEDVFYGKTYTDTCDIMRGFNASFTGRYDTINKEWIDAEIFKFIVDGTNGKRREGFESDANWTIYRMADIMCLNCEAYNRKGYYRESIMRLQGSPYWPVRWSFKPQNEGPMGLRKRACVKEYISNDDVTPDMYEAEEIILEERAKELAFEGRRWFDLIRIAKRGQLDLILDEMEFAASEDRKAFVRAQMSNPDNWFLPYSDKARENFVNKNYKNKAIEKVKSQL
ncbi:MAG: RagB/SusD family nutrient uptake outer membrane protein [Carboxylicivirga sp.]|jgi:hypothetical protein|nr:RagB/SusD family nutrient uptake outer membrane protein [Carboxylicivirga sp.]